MTDQGTTTEPRIAELEAELRRREAEIADLVSVGVALSAERDLGALLQRILRDACRIAGADAGSLYVAERNERGQPAQTLRFKLSRNESVEFRSQEFSLPVSMSSVAGFVAASRRPLNLPDAYQPPPDAPYRLDRSFDERTGYRSRSMLVWPMVSHRDELIGVLQLINRKLGPEPLRGPEEFAARVVPFDRRTESLVAALAAQAAVAIENALLYEDMARAFEGFVQASVHAIEQRDPTTMGHSVRVAALTVGLAREVHRCDRGWLDRVQYDEDDLQELRWAALLHDFGKVGVREQVLLKSKKLYPADLDRVIGRFQYARKAAEAEAWRRRVEAGRHPAPEEALRRVDQDLEERLRGLDDALRTIHAMNEPTVLPEGSADRLAELAQLVFTDTDGAERPLLLPEELGCLRIARGSLAPAEVQEIQSHARHTFEFLSRIPWGRRFHRLPFIAGAHHEKLDGTGYFRGLRGDEIPTQSKIMAIADIYDALTASDRPYKRAVPVPRALEILWLEVKDNHLDADLVRLFVETEAYRAAETDGG